MYSRRFADAQRDPPPDYSGTAYQSTAPAAEETRRGEQAPWAEEKGGECLPRRPLYRAPRNAGRRPAPKDRKEEKNGESRFSGEDLLLAGLILMLLSDREKSVKPGVKPGEKPDGEMLLLLGLLLFMR